VLAACWRRSGVLTDAEFAELRYGGRGAALLRVFKALYFGTVFNCFALAIVLLAATRIAEPFLLWHEWLPGGLFKLIEAVVWDIGFAPTTLPVTDPMYWTKAADNTISVLSIALITLFYSTLGGLRSVVKTDVVQFAIMMVASLVYAVLVVNAAGGLQTMIDRLGEMFTASGPGISATQLLAFTPSMARDVSALLIAVVCLQWLIQVNADGTGYLAQRAMACRSDHEARRAAVVFTFAQVLIRSLIWLPIALGLLLIFPPHGALGGVGYVAEREATFVRGIAETLPAGVKGLMLTGMIAALASTVDTHLNWGSSYWTNDIYLRFICRWLKRQPTAPEQVWVARISNVLILAIALVIMAQLDSVKVAWESSLLLGAGVGIVLVLRWLWWRMTAWGELAAIVGSAVLVPLALYYVPDHLAELRMLVVAAGSTVAAVVASLWVEPVAAKSLVEFYRKVQPPGFWGAVAREAGEDEHAPLTELERGIAAVVLAALSIFCLLVGLGTWLVHATPPAWLPERNVWIALNLTLGVALVPLWLHLGFRGRLGERESSVASRKS